MGPRPLPREELLYESVVGAIRLELVRLRALNNVPLARQSMPKSAGLAADQQPYEQSANSAAQSVKLLWGSGSRSLELREQH